jgi:hypothetical protein
MDGSTILALCKPIDGRLFASSRCDLPELNLSLPSPTALSRPIRIGAKNRAGLGHVTSPPKLPGSPFILLTIP